MRALPEGKKAAADSARTKTNSTGRTFLARITSYNVCYTKLLRFLYLFHDALRGFYREKPVLDLTRRGLSARQLFCVRGCMEDKRIKDMARITSYNVCYTKLLRMHQ